MKLKGFEYIGVGDTGEVQVDTKAVEAEVAAAAEAEIGSVKASSEARGVKVDRRAKLAPKPKMEVGPGDVELSKEHIEEAREELWIEGNQNPSEEQIKKRARMGVFSTMSEEKLADNIVDAMIADPDSHQKIIEKVNQSLKTEFVIQAGREAAERERQAKAEISKKTAEVIRLAKEKSAQASEKVDNNKVKETKVEAKVTKKIEPAIELEVVENIPNGLRVVENAPAQKEALRIGAGEIPEVIENKVEPEKSSVFADRKYEVEQRRKWQEVDRTEAIEQERKREEVERVKALEQEHKREEVERVAALERKAKEEKPAATLEVPEILEKPQKESLRTVLRRMILGKK